VHVISGIEVQVMTKRRNVNVVTFELFADVVASVPRNPKVKQLLEVSRRNFPDHFLRLMAILVERNLSPIGKADESFASGNVKADAGGNRFCLWSRSPWSRLTAFKRLLFI